VIAGIGNIYSDEILWRACVHPLSQVNKIPEKNLRLAFTAMKEVLKKGIDFGGDSMSDYRNIKGEKGSFQEHHRAYKLNKKNCLKRGCEGVIERMVVGMRSAHFCPIHQTLYK
jgi:formamidopyrimidine-DNA glycosylase